MIEAEQVPRLAVPTSACSVWMFYDSSHGAFISRLNELRTLVLIKYCTVFPRSPAPSLLLLSPLLCYILPKLPSPVII